MTLLLATALFLPLFPFSMPLNWLLARLANPVARSMLLLLWPQIGIALLSLASQKIPDGMVVWALLSSGFYALRLLTVRDLGLWAGFLASSALALVWGLAVHGSSVLEMQMFAFAFSLPAALLALLTGTLTERFGTAFAGLYGGLASSLPRLSGMLVFTMLAAIATPPSPSFFAMLDLLDKLGWPIVPGVLVSWLLWSWAAVKLLEGFISGVNGVEEAGMDVGRTATALYMGLISTFVVTGLFLMRGLP